MKEKRSINESTLYSNSELLADPLLKLRSTIPAPIDVGISF